MKATLEFNLDDHYERKAHKRAISADSAYLALSEFSEELRRLRKYGEYPTNSEELLELLTSSFYTCLEERDVNLSDLE